MNRSTPNSHVGLHALDGVALEQGQVLVGRRVEDDVWPKLADDRADSLPVADVGEHREVVVEQPVSAEPQLHRVHRRLVVVQDVERLRTHLSHLPRQLATDRTAATGHQYSAALDQTMRTGGGHRLVRSPEQLLRPERPRSNARQSAPTLSHPIPTLSAFRSLPFLRSSRARSEPNAPTALVLMH